MNLNDCRPLIHFTPSYGWLNDPNGLVYHDGVYELYYQSNPKALYWGGMSWGHARSGDLMHWENLGTVMTPDETGTMFSGSGILSRPGDAGEEEACLCFPYTAAGTDPSADADLPGAYRPYFTIRLAKSYDGGDTLVKTGRELLKPYAPDNRDPKIFYHEESGAYIIVLWLKGNTFGIYRSKDLSFFELSSTVDLEGGFECPDLFRLPAVDEQDRPIPDRPWVFWAGDGSYYIGEFDGYTFTQTEPRKRSCMSMLPYAAQTFSGDPKGRVISVAWLRTKTIQDAYTGAMSLPWELSLKKTPMGFVLRHTLPEEITQAASPVQVSDKEALPVCDGAVLLRTQPEEGMSVRFVNAAGEEFFSVRKEDDQLFISSRCVGEYVRVFGQGKAPALELIYDRGILEMTFTSGLFYTALDFPELRSEKISRIILDGSTPETELSLIR